MRQATGDNSRAFLDLLGRVVEHIEPAETRGQVEPEPPRLILP
jgi:hypothetical protein